jgi:magnesium transporter
MLKATCHVPGKGWVDVADLDSISDLRALPGGLLWGQADVRNLPEGDVALIAEEFELDPQAVEDAVNVRERPKLELYDKHVLAVWHQLDEEDGQLEARQIAWFVGEDYVLALHAGVDRILSEAKTRWTDATSAQLEQGPAFLMYTLVDVLVDDYGAIADRLEDEVEQLEEFALSLPGIALDKQLYTLKQRLSRLRRYVLPGSRVLDNLVGDEGRHIVSPEQARLFRDVNDHLLRISDQVHTIDELSNAVLDLRRSEQAAHLSEINKKLTAWAAIIAVPTLISSTYGMNFELLPPEQSLEGFWFALSLMVLTAVGLFFYFKRKGWL